MLNLATEKQDKEKLIIKSDISVKAVPFNPFEAQINLALPTGLYKFSKEDITFHEEKESTIANNNIDSVTFLRNRQLEYATKDLKGNPNNPYLINNLGLAYLGKRDLDGALKLFREAIHINSTFTNAKLNLASVLLMKNEYDQARIIYEDILRSNPNDLRACINLGDLLLKANSLDQAKEIFTKVLCIESTNISARIRLALIYIIQGKHRESVAEIRKCLAIKGNSPSLYNLLGVAFGIAGLYHKAVLSFRTALAISPTYSGAVVNLATTLRLQKKIGEVIELINDYLRKGENRRLREILFEINLETGDFKTGLKNILILLSEAKKKNASLQELSRIFNNMGVVYFNLSNYKEAEEYFLKSLADKNCANQINLQNIIDLYFFLEDIQKAKEFIDIFREVYGERSLYLFYSGLYKTKTFEPDRAIESLTEFININTKYVPAYTALGFVYSEYFGDYNKAIEVTRQGLSQDPDNLGLINNLAYDYLMNGEVDKAKSTLERVAKVENYMYLVATRGLLKIKEGNIAKGKELYRKAIFMAKNEYVGKQVEQKMYYEIAKYYFNNNNVEEAMRILVKMLSSINVSSIYYNQARDFLDNMKSSE
jgi:tetratricopeptide (TPR) repeat protein